MKKFDVKIEEDLIRCKITKPLLVENIQGRASKPRVDGYIPSAIACCIAKSSNLPVILEDYAELKSKNEISFNIKILEKNVE